MIKDGLNDILYYLDSELTENCYETYTFNSSKDLMDAIDFISPDLILLDVRLAEIMDGKILCMELKQHHHFINPIYLFSASSIIYSNLLTCGADGFIKKPFDLQDILDTINNALTY